MSSRVLLMESSEKFRVAIKRILQRERPDLIVYEHNIGKDGIPTRNLNWLTYELVLLDYRFGLQHAMEWLSEIKHQSNFPAIVVLTGSSPDSEATAQALGADETINKRKLTKTMLMSTIEFALKFAETRRKDHQLLIRNQTGPKIPGYEITSKVAEGGMSSIYLAKRASDGEQVVMKILYSEYIEDETFVDRFLQEYELIARLSDPNIVKIYAQSYTEEFMYMIMEYFPNGDLHKRISRSKGLPLPEALRYLMQIASGLRAIHSCGIVHRDLKPSNIMFRANDSLAIIDFGISKELMESADITSENMVMGTVGYMSPEAGQGKPMDERTDIYSLGIMFHEMLVGRKPYIGKDPADVVLKHVKAPIPWLPERFKPAQGLFEIMVAKEAENRFQTAGRLIEFVESRFGDLLKQSA
ncbi:MAG TPA: protein kinase [Gammaproteobacteria bacterium]|nr:protein kinase [Gammaproteobacteria bacterium]